MNLTQVMRSVDKVLSFDICWLLQLFSSFYRLEVIFAEQESAYLQTPFFYLKDRKNSKKSMKYFKQIYTGKNGGIPKCKKKLEFAVLVNLFPEASVQKSLAIAITILPYSTSDDIETTMEYWRPGLITFSVECNTLAAP